MFVCFKLQKVIFISNLIFIYTLKRKKYFESNDFQLAHLRGRFLFYGIRENIKYINKVRIIFVSEEKISPELFYRNGSKIFADDIILSTNDTIELICRGLSPIFWDVPFTRDDDTCIDNSVSFSD